MLRLISSASTKQTYILACKIAICPTVGDIDVVFSLTLQVCKAG